MEQEKFGKFIKDIRKKHNLTQKQFAEKYNITYQAVSKWENGLNMPDTSLIKQISKDFNISIEELLDGEYKETKKRKKYLIISIAIIVLFALCLVAIIIFKPFQNDNDFEFKTLSTECENFNISGNIAYNENKSAIYITNIKYCGGDDTEEYKQIECTLYETNNNIEKKISTVKSERAKIKLEDFLQDITLSIDNYEKTCKEYQKNSLYLSISATNYNEKITTYRIPLKFDDCSK